MVIRKLGVSLGVVVMFTVSPSWGNGVEFHDLDFGPAVQRATAEDKLVFIDFFTTWCLPCKVMDATTFQDPEVAAWLARNTVALRLDAEADEANAALAKRLGVESFPNYVFVSPEGKVVDRILGMRSSAEFIATGESIRRGENAVVRAERALSEGDPDDPMLRARLADAYLESGRTEDALREYLWCFDEGEGLTGRHTAIPLIASVLARLAGLAKRYPPAMDALIERRAAARQRILGGSTEFHDIDVFLGINGSLGDGAATLAFYQDAREGGSLSSLAEMLLRDESFRILVDARRYDEIVADYDLSARVDREFTDFHTVANVQVDGNQILESDLFDDDMRELLRRVEKAYGEDMVTLALRSAREELRREVADAYEVLMGAGLVEQAAALAGRLVGELDDAQTRNALAWAGYLTGSPIGANLVQARQAFELTDGEDFHIVDTLARVLATLGRYDEAVAIAESGLDKATTTRDRRLMRECLEYCREQSAG